jgi:hypothetical protein
MRTFNSRTHKMLSGFILFILWLLYPTQGLWFVPVSGAVADLKFGMDMAVLRDVLLNWTPYHLRVRPGHGCSPISPVKLDALSPTDPIGGWLFSKLSCQFGRFITYGSGRDVAVLRLVLLSWTLYHLRIRSRGGFSPSCPVKLDTLSPTGPVGIWLFSKFSCQVGRLSPRNRSGDGCFPSCPVTWDALSPTGPFGTWLFYDFSC